MPNTSNMDIQSSTSKAHHIQTLSSMCSDENSQVETDDQKESEIHQNANETLQNSAASSNFVMTNQKIKPNFEHETFQTSTSASSNFVMTNQKTKSNFEQHLAVNHNFPSGNTNTNQNQDAIQHKRYIKSTIIYAALVLALIVCTTPLYLYTLVAKFWSCCFQPRVAKNLFILLYFNSCLNPILYALTNKKLRQFYRNKLQKLLRR